MNKSTKEWADEFREYFDKALKPKKPTMGNLDRELCVDFISKLLSKERERVIEMVEEMKKEHLFTCSARVHTANRQCDCGKQEYNSALIKVLSKLKG